MIITLGDALKELVQKLEKDRKTGTQKISNKNQINT